MQACEHGETLRITLYYHRPAPCFSHNRHSYPSSYPSYPSLGGRVGRVGGEGGRVGGRVGRVGGGVGAVRGTAARSLALSKAKTCPQLLRITSLCIIPGLALRSLCIHSLGFAIIFVVILGPQPGPNLAFYYWEIQARFPNLV